MLDINLDNATEISFIDSRAFKEYFENGRAIVLRKVIEEVKFEDSESLYYVSVIKELHKDDDFDNPQSEAIVKQSFYDIKDEEKAFKYYYSDIK